MTTLLLILSLARAAYAAPLAAPTVRCERHLGEDFIDTIRRMKTLRTIPTHDPAGFPTAALRAVLDNHLENVFPDDVRALNATPLPELHVKAEEKIVGERSSHALMVLKIPGGTPAAVIHAETHGDEVSFLTMPLGEPAVREIREALLEAYQLRDPLSPRADQMRMMALFADDRLRVDPTRSNGLAETDYADVLQIEADSPRRADAWHLTLRRDPNGASLLRYTEDDEDHLDVIENSAVAVTTALARLRDHLVNHPAEDLNIFVGEGAEPEMWYGKILLERNLTGHALRLPDDELTHELIAEIYRGYAHLDVFDRYTDETGSFVRLRADGARQIKVLIERLHRRLNF